LSKYASIFGSKKRYLKLHIYFNIYIISLYCYIRKNLHQYCDPLQAMPILFIDASSNKARLKFLQRSERLVALGMMGAQLRSPPWNPTYVTAIWYTTGVKEGPQISPLTAKRLSLSDGLGQKFQSGNKGLEPWSLVKIGKVMPLFAKNSA